VTAVFMEEVARLSFEIDKNKIKNEKRGICGLEKKGCCMIFLKM
jgi:hypothetical protein